ncbi:MAG: hypothetical protein ACM336_12365 [Acidobacteriota bacterium]
MLETPVATFVAVRVAFGTAAPEASVTVPVIVAQADWPRPLHECGTRSRAIHTLSRVNLHLNIYSSGD